MTPRSELRITDTTLRDGSHAVNHMFTVDQVRRTVRALDQAGVPVLEVSHGDGLGGSSFNYGFGATSEIELIAAAAEEAVTAKIAALLIPGIGRVVDMRDALAAGAQVMRVATHCTEADISRQHFHAARELGLETVGFLMLAHMIDAPALAEQARIMVNAGCQCVYVVDSAGAMLMDDVKARVTALVDSIGQDADVGFHAHNNLGVGIANSVIAYRAGARQIDGATRGLGAGAGNAATELLVAVFDRIGIPTGIDMFKAIDAAEDVVASYIDGAPFPNRGSIMLGYAGAYSSFLRHAQRASARYGVPTQDILLAAGERKYVGGQEDMLIGIAIELGEARRVAEDVR
jgi:4-hydroxy 2-oxovalerate aldolase